MEALYNTSCILNSVRSAAGRSISQEDIGDCLLNTDAGFGSVRANGEKKVTHLDGDEILSTI